MSTLFDDASIPRYVQLSDMIRQRIANGEWAPGDMVPSLGDLMAEFSVSRVTVRQAMQLLAREGLLSPQRGRGTFVTAEAGRKRRLQVQTTLKDLVEMYRGDIPDLSNIVESMTPPVLTEADGKPAPKYFHMRRIHARDGENYCVISIYIDNRIFRRAPVRLRREVVLPILTSLPGVEIDRAWQTLRISRADSEVARQLQVPLNTPVGEVRRVMCAPDGTVIYLGEVTYRGDYVHLEMDLRP